MTTRWLFGPALLLTAFVAVSGRQAPSPPAAQPPVAGDPAVADHLEVPPPPFSEGVYPCMFCHADFPPDRKRRPMVEDHEAIVLKHDEDNRWCLDCHDEKNHDVLHLASGEPLPFEESYKLCGQCHGEKYRDWRAGVHGRRTGQWNGRKGYLLCVNCHSAHEPQFKAMAPKAAPARPTRPR